MLIKGVLIKNSMVFKIQWNSVDEISKTLCMVLKTVNMTRLCVSLIVFNTIVTRNIYRNWSNFSKMIYIKQKYAHFCFQLFWKYWNILQYGNQYNTLFNIDWLFKNIYKLVVRTNSTNDMNCEIMFDHAKKCTIMHIELFYGCSKWPHEAKKNEGD